MRVRHRWQQRIRSYSAAVMLNLALVSPPPVAPVIEPTPIVRAFGRRLAGFDPMEKLGANLILTLPFDQGSVGNSDTSRVSLN